MPSRMRSYLSSPTAVFTAIAFYVFAMWQVFNHVYLMHLQMVTYHLVSLVVETLGAGVVAFFVVRELSRTNEKLEELHRQKDMLTSALVHDLRQPLTAVIAGLDTAELDPNLPEQTRELLAIAHTGGAQLLAMVNDLLDVTRLEAGKPLTQRADVQPAAFIKEGVEPLGPLARESGIALAVDVPDDLPAVTGDAERLRRVVMNLVGNALKFTPSGGSVRVAARVDSDQGQLAVSVSDTGQGIPQEYHERIFDKFAIVDERNAGARSSTGLGLTFCKMVIEAHGGRIWVESEPGQGATFTFALPLPTREVTA